MYGQNTSGDIRKTEVGRIAAAALLGLALCLLSSCVGYLYCMKTDVGTYVLERADGIEGWLSLAYDEVKYFAAVFFAGFTVFAPIVGAAVLGLRFAAFGGALCMFLGSGRTYGTVVSFAVSCALPLLLFVGALVSVMHARTLKYAAPDIRSMLGYRDTRGYVRAFAAIVSVVLLHGLLRGAALSLLS